MKLDIEQLERQNDRFAIGGNVPRFLTYDDPYSLDISRQARKIIQIGEIWNDPSSAELSLLLRTISSHSRSILLPDGEFKEYFDELSIRISQQLVELKGLVPLEILDETEMLNSKLTNLAESSLKLRLEALSSVFKDVYKNYLVVGETSALRKRALIWAQTASESLRGQINALGSLSELENGTHNSYDEICILGAPSRLLVSNGLKPSHLRVLITSGLGYKSTFCYPSWLRDIEDSTFWLDLYSGLPIVQSQKIEREATGQKIVSDPIVDEAQNWDEEVFFFDAKSSEISKLTRQGTVACSLIQCVDGLVFPIEITANSVGAITVSAQVANSTVISDVNLDNLRIGDALVARVDSSEKESLRSNTLIRIGEVGQQFLKTQTVWKTQLLQRNQQQGWSVVESQLRQLGMSVNPRPEAWSFDLSLGPGNSEDFKKLLMYLGWNLEDSQVASELVRTVWNELIHEGHLTRRAIQSALSGEHLEALRANRAVRISLEDHGDATYVVAPVVSSSFISGKCEATQLRRFVTS